ncbi:MAG: hypothetical protein QXW42_04180 [Thermofilum sp.]
MSSRHHTSSRWYLTSLLILMGAVFLFLYVRFMPAPFNPFAILPTFEGLSSGVEGATIDGSFYRIDQPLPEGYRWLANDPHSAILEKHRNPLMAPGQVRVEVGQPRRIDELFTVGRKVHYWVKVSDTQFVEVEGEIVTYELHATVSAINVFGIDEWFSGEKVWISLTSLTWNKAYQKVGADYGQAWEAPLAVVIEGYEVRDAGEHYKVEPSMSGRWVTLYDSPRQEGTISDLGLSSYADINQSLAGDLSPDSRLRRTAYFAFNLADFGVTDHFLWSSAPVVDYKLKIYTLQIGKFTYTNPDKTPWGERQPEEDWIDMFLKWFSDTFGVPLSIAGWAVLGIILFVVFTLAMIFIVAVAVRARVEVREG